MPTAELTEEDFEGNEIDILTLLLKSGLVPSKSEARRAVQQVELQQTERKLQTFMRYLQKMHCQERVSF